MTSHMGSRNAWQLDRAGHFPQCNGLCCTPFSSMNKDQILFELPLRHVISQYTRWPWSWRTSFTFRSRDFIPISVTMSPRPPKFDFRSKSLRHRSLWGSKLKRGDNITFTWTQFMRLRIGINGGLFWKWWWALGLKLLSDWMIRD